MTTVTRRYTFESAHWLPGVPETHKCHRIHGHNYVMEVTLVGSINQKTGFIIDFWDMDKVIQPLVDTIDHRLLNDINGLQNPTAEYISHWFLKRLEFSFPTISVWNIRIYETPNCWADCGPA